MTNRSYLNFELSLERSGEFYRARVLQSCAGEGSYEFDLPFSDIELENFILKLGHVRRATGRKIRGSDSPEMQAAKRFGGKLFETVFQGDVYACLRASLDEANSQGQGVRLLLRLDPELADIPWEYLYNPAWNQFFALSADTPLVRYLELTPPIYPLPVRPPLRLLAAIASPEGYPKLDVEHEWRNLQSALEPLVSKGMLEIERLERPDLLSLQRQLRRSEYHVFHFIGHGTYEENTEDGLLVFTDEFGHGKPLSGQYLGTLLRDHHTLRLALLNACEGARTGREDPFAGVAQSLVQMGMPAVIAMQFEISDSAAILFAQEFYTALADGYPVDAALTDARKAIFSSNDREWGTPVLFSRILDGRIFELTQSAAASATQAVKEPGAAPVKTRPQKEELETRRLYEDGLSAFYLEDWERAVECFQAVLQMQPGHAEAAEKLAQAEHDNDLAQRYAQAQQQSAAQDWEGASQTLALLAAEAPQYRDAAALLQTARKRARLAELYSDATRLTQAAQWAAVVSVLEQMRQIDADCPDPDGLLPAAKSALVEEKRQEKLAALYKQALQALEARNWREARQRLEQVNRLQANYRDTPRLMEKAKTELARPAKPVKRLVEVKDSVPPAANPAAEAVTVPRKPSSWLRRICVIGGVILLVGVVVLGVIFADSLGWLGGWTGSPKIITDSHGVKMAFIPAGEFQMGSNIVTSSSNPVHTVYISEPFHMDIYEVTNSAYAACVTAGGCDAFGYTGSALRNSYYGSPTYVAYPLINVLWDQAQAYCAWRGGSLPTEAQWEYAARGGLQGKAYPWGDQAPVCTSGAGNGANYAGCIGDTVYMGRYAPNDYGLYDMAGNVSEWVADWYQSDYYDTYPEDGWPDDPHGPNKGDYRVIRGGNWNSRADNLRTAHRNSTFSRSNSIGFRCVIPAGD